MGTQNWGASISLLAPTIAIMPDDSESTADPHSNSIFRFASIQGSAADTARRRSQRFSQVSVASRVTDISDVTDLPSEADWEMHEGRRFQSQAKGSEKRPHQPRRLASIVDSGGMGPELPAQKLACQGYGAFSDEGFNASYNQDALLMVTNVADIPNSVLFGVFDGHGNHGDEVAHFAKDTLHKKFLEKIGTEKHVRTLEEMNNIFRASFLETHAEMEKKGDQFLLTGTTASVVFIQNENLYLAHVGDSRIVLGRECPACLHLNKFQSEKSISNRTSSHIIAYGATTDHRVGEITAERERVEKAGGEVKLDPRLPPGSTDELRIYAKDQQYPGLVTSRTLGDLLGHSLGVTSEPEVSHKVIDEYDKFLILGSDGVWDILSNQETVNLVAKFRDPSEATNALVDECVKGWSDEFDVGDNVSAIVLYLNQFYPYAHIPKTSLTKAVAGCGCKWTWGELAQSKDIKQIESVLRQAQQTYDESQSKLSPQNTTSASNIAASSVTSKTKIEAKQINTRSEKDSKQPQPFSDVMLGGGGGGMQLVPQKKSSRSGLCALL